MTSQHSPAGRVRSILLKMLLLLTLGPPSLSAQDVSVTASISPSPVGEEDPVSLSIEVSGSGGAEEPSLPKLAGLKLIRGPSISNEFRWVNGQSSSSKRFTYVFRPEKAGMIDIPAIPVRVAGRTYLTNVLRLEVVQGSTAGRAQQQRGAGRRSLLEEMWPNDEFFQRPQSRPEGEVLTDAILDRKKVFQGQQVTLTYRLLTQIAVSQVEIEELPALKGFWVEEIDLPKSPSAEMRDINGKKYSVYVIKKQALFPTTTGRLKIPSASFSVTVRTQLGGVFSLGSQERVVRKTAPLAIEVRPLPKAPLEFSGAVGEFELTSALDRTQARVGEALRLEAALSGVGNLKTITEFSLPDLPGLKIYSSKSTDKPKIQRGLLQGTKIWEFVLVPQVAGKTKIPAFTFSYFSPTAGQYRVARSLPLEVAIDHAEESIEGGSPPMISHRDLVRKAFDIHYIKLPKGELQDRSGFVYQSSWTYVILSLPLFLNGGLLLYFRQRNRLQRDVVGLRSRRAHKIAHRRLAEARKCLKNKQLTHFHRIFEQSLTGYLTDKFNLPQIEMTSAQIRKFMEAQDLDRTRSQEVIALLEECHYARYAPTERERSGLQQLLQRAENFIVGLEGDLSRSSSRASL